MSLNMLGPHVTHMEEKVCIPWRMGGGCESGREIEVNTIQGGKAPLHEHPDVASIRNKLVTPPMYYISLLN